MLTARIVSAMNKTSGFLKVLVVDDVLAVRERLVSLLEEIPGVVIAGQTSGVAETLAAIRALDPDVVTLDFCLPDGTGLDVLRARAVEQLRAMVLVLTNHALPEYKQAAIAAGANAFFSKSEQLVEAIAIIRQLASDAVREQPTDPCPLPMRAKGTGGGSQ